jgi:hypothetical protein
MLRIKKMATVTLILSAMLLFLCACQTSSNFTKEDLVGTWEWKGQFFVRFDLDGSFQMAIPEYGYQLDNIPADIGVFELEGTKLTLISDVESMECSGQTGIYNIEQVEDSGILLVPEEDDCFNRSSGLENSPLTKMAP